RPGAGSDAAAPDGHVTYPQLALLPAGESQLQLYEIARLVRRRLDRRTRAYVHIAQPDPLVLDHVLERVRVPFADHGVADDDILARRRYQQPRQVVHIGHVVT